MYFYIFCSQTAVSWNLWFTREAAFTQWHLAGRDVLWWMVPSENHGAAFGSMTVLREGVFYLISILNVWSACLGSPQTTCLAVLRCSCGTELSCNHGIIPSLYCAGTQVFLVAWIPVMSQSYGRRNFVLFATEIQRGSFPCGGMAIGNHCVWKSLNLTLCFFSWLYVRLDFRTYGEVLLFSS